MPSKGPPGNEILENKIMKFGVNFKMGYRVLIVTPRGFPSETKSRGLVVKNLLNFFDKTYSKAPRCGPRKKSIKIPLRKGIIKKCEKRLQNFTHDLKNSPGVSPSPRVVLNVLKSRCQQILQNTVYRIKIESRKKT